VKIRTSSGERPAVSPRATPASGTNRGRPAQQLDGVTARRIGPAAFFVAIIGILVFGAAFYWKTSHNSQTKTDGPPPAEIQPEVKASEKSPAPSTIANNASQPSPATTPTPAVVPQYDPLSRGLVAHWRFDEASGDVALDSTGNHNEGKLTRGVTRVPGKIGGALQFDGTSGYVGIGRVLFKDLPTFAIALWVKPTATPGNRTGLAGQNDSLEFGFDGAQVCIWTAGGGGISAPWTFPNNEWHHITAIGTSLRVKIFIDAKEVASLDQKTENYGGSGFNFNIGGGGIWDDKGNFFTGAIDDVRLYAFSLDETQIKAIYELGARK
jgi:hypothetical protein